MVKSPCQEVCEYEPKEGALLEKRNKKDWKRIDTTFRSCQLKEEQK